MLAIFDTDHILKSFGILGVALIVFAESGLLIGFILPGDTLLFAAGFFASTGKLPIVPLVAAIVAAAIVGDNVGYTFGKRIGPKLFKKEDGILFRKEYITKSEAFYEKHGGKTITIARFVPIVRTFAPLVAGASSMPYRKFLKYNIIGGLLWGGGVTILGYYLGSKIPNVEKYIIPIMLFAMIVSFAGPILHMVKDKKIRAKIFKKKPSE